MIYLINEVASDGYWYGNESYPYTSKDMDDVIHKAYFGDDGYKNSYEADPDDIDGNEEMLSFEEFYEIMKYGFEEGFGGEKEGYVVIQFYNSHIQFEPYKIET